MLVFFCVGLALLRDAGRTLAAFHFYIGVTLPRRCGCGLFRSGQARHLNNSSVWCSRRVSTLVFSSLRAGFCSPSGGFSSLDPLSTNLFAPALRQSRRRPNSATSRIEFITGKFYSKRTAPSRWPSWASDPIPPIRSSSSPQQQLGCFG